MATTTTNYGFDVPTSSDLVKNGATAISTLGQDLDTFLFRPFTRNGVINGAFDIWQRGTSFAAPTNNTFVADRWAWSSSSVASKTISRQSSGLTGFQYSIRVARDSGNTNTANNYIGYSMETSDALRFAGQTITFSFYAKAGANYSPTSSLLGLRLGSGTGTDQNFLTGGYTGNVNLIDTTQAITTTWTRYSFTVAVGSTANELGLFFYSTPTGTAGANDWYEITGVQVEVGNQVSPFTRAGGGTIQGELAACQRYYQLLASGLNKFLAVASVYSASQLDLLISFPEMRIAPSLVATSGTGYYTLIRNGGGDNFNSLTLNGYTTTRGAALYNNTEISSTAGNAGWVYTDNASASVALNAEL